MICKKCGAQIDENSIFCPYCGTRTNGESTNSGFGFDPYSGTTFFAPDSRESRLVAILAFCFWQVGLILWLVWRRVRPGKAMSALKGTLSATCFQFPVAGLVLWLLWRNDNENRKLAKIGAVSAIVGASFIAVAAILLLVLAYSGNLVLPDISQLVVPETNAAFLQWRSIF